MRTLLVALLAAAGVVLAAPAGADPADLVPYCSGDQTPMDYACQATPSQEFTHGHSGVSPDLPFGLNPGNEPAV